MHRRLHTYCKHVSTTRGTARRRAAHGGNMFAIHGAAEHTTTRLKPFLSRKRLILAQKWLQICCSMLRRTADRNCVAVQRNMLDHVWDRFATGMV
eukprot:8993512-Lingulodinium_polyedra.AAC.2